MKNLTILNVVLLFNGLIIHAIYAIIKQKKQNVKFSLGFYIKDNWLTMLATAIAAFSSLLMADDIAKLIHVHTEEGSPFYAVHSFISGILPMFFITRILKAFNASSDSL